MDSKIDLNSEGNNWSFYNAWMELRNRSVTINDQMNDLHHHFDHIMTFYKESIINIIKNNQPFLTKQQILDQLHKIEADTNQMVFFSLE